MPETWTASRGVDLQISLPTGCGRRASLESGLREAIRSGRLRAGEPLPSTRALAAELHLARGTVVEAYAQLAAEGYLHARPGARTMVAEVQMPEQQSEDAPGTRRAEFDFRLGRPDPSSFPRQAWLRALRQSLAEAPDRTFGPVDTQGLVGLRESLAAYLGRARGVRASSTSTLVCNGFVQGLRLVCDILAANGKRTIAMEDPCLPDHRAVAQAAGLEVVALPVDQHGACIDELDHLGADAVVVTPAHQAVLGATLGPDRRSGLVRWAVASGALIVEDDYDAEFRFDRHPVGALQGTAPDHVVYVGSASKTLASALRLGWLVVPPWLSQEVVAYKRRADRGSGVLDQLALARLIDSGGLDRHVRVMRSRYRQRRDVLVAALGRVLPEATITGIAAGVHLTALLPGGPEAEALLVSAAADRSIALHGLAPFWHEPPAEIGGLVLGYGASPAHSYQRAVSELERLLTDCARS